jgi:hypothetical protein
MTIVRPTSDLILVKKNPTGKMPAQRKSYKKINSTKIGRFWNFFEQIVRPLTFRLNFRPLRVHRSHESTQEISENTVVSVKPPNI